MLHAKDMQSAKIIKLQRAFYNNFKVLTHLFSDFTEEFTNPNNILVVQFPTLQPRTKKQGSGVNPNSSVDNFDLATSSSC
jgi:hypothetical protein